MTTREMLLHEFGGQLDYEKLADAFMEICREQSEDLLCNYNQIREPIDIARDAYFREDKQCKK